MPEKRFYTPDDLVEMGYGCINTVRQRIREGKIPAIRDGQRYLIPRDDFEAFLEAKRSQRAEELGARHTA